MSDQFAGKRGKCPKCGSPVAIPAAATSAQEEPPPLLSTDADEPASPSPQPQRHSPLRGATPGYAAGWSSMSAAQDMQASSGFGSPDGPMSPAWGDAPQQVAAPAKKRFDSETIKRVKKLGSGFVGFVVACLVSWLVRSALEPDLGNLSWQSYKSAQGRFRVEMPGDAQTHSKDFSTESGPLTLWLEGVKLTSDIAFFVSYWDLPSIVGGFDPQDCLDVAVEGINAEDQVHSHTHLEWDGYPGREVYYTVHRNKHLTHGRSRFFVVGHRLYQVQYLGEEGTLDHPDVERFLNSFHPE